MPATAPGVVIIIIKQTVSGNFKFSLQNPNGGMRLQFVMNSADMATAAALAGGSSVTFTYPEDQNRLDYDRDVTFEV